MMTNGKVTLMKEARLHKYPLKIISKVFFAAKSPYGHCAMDRDVAY